jgi:hypothetical protein
MHDTSLWGEVDTSTLNAREKKRFNKFYAAIRNYFTCEDSLEEIAQKHHISAETLEKLAQQCLLQHEDGKPWGFRSLLPGVVDHAAEPDAAADPTDEAPTEAVPDATAAEAEVTEVESIESPPTQAAPAEPIPDEVQPVELADAMPAEAAPGEPTPTEAPPATSKEELVTAIEDNSVDQEAESSEHTGVTGNTHAALSLDKALDDAEASDDELAEDTDKHQAVKVQPVALETEEPEVHAATAAGQETEPSSGDHIEEARPDGEDEANLHPAGQEQDAPEIEAVIAGVEAEETASQGDAGRQLVPSFKAEVADATDFITALVPFCPEGRYRMPFKKVIQQRRLVRKRWERDERQQRQRKRLRRLFSIALVAAILLTIVMPVGIGLAAYSVYSNVRGLAADGVNRLLHVKSVLNVDKSNPTAALNATKLQQAQNDFNKAESDFIELQQLVNRSDVQNAITQFAPEYGGKLAMAQRLVQVGLDISRMGSEMSDVAILGANIIHSSPLASGSNKPLITVSDITAVEGAVVHALYYIDDVRLQMSQVQMKDLPISNKQKAQLTSALALLPTARSAIVQAQGLVSIVSWLLGVGHDRRFLVQTMDRAELRPGGGFTGQYGILEIQNGRMAPFSLRDVALLDYAGNGIELGRLPPPQYRWMNFGNWGLRDSNLSGDFPTSAKLAMQVFQEEGGGPIDGDIALTPVVISHILDVIGPIKVAEYGEVITAKNLEERLHYYQQNYAAIAIEQQKTHDYSHQARKSFTSLVGKLLLDKVRHAPVSQLIRIAKNAVKDIQSRDLEIYFNNPAAEAWLVEHGYSGAMDTYSKHDGFMVVQANISISKASQYVHTTEHDSITLDSHGGATHHLTITLTYNQTGPVYGFDTYADYIRVYAPATAQFLDGDGFDTGKPLCKPTTAKSHRGGQGNLGPTTGCSQYNKSFPSSARYCPSGNYSLGARGYTLNNSKGAWVIDSLGAPTALTSDLPGRAMFGGLTETPKNCISTITVSWYVPHAVKHAAGQAPYSILVQKQGGYVPTVEIEVDTSAIKGLKPFSFKGNLVADRLFSLPALVLTPKKK